MPDIWLPFIKDDTPIILDLSDIAKPYAKKMDYLATVRDGSTGQLVNGYWLVEFRLDFIVKVVILYKK